MAASKTFKKRDLVESLADFVKNSQVIKQSIKMDGSFSDHTRQIEMPCRLSMSKFRCEPPLYPSWAPQKSSTSSASLNLRALQISSTFAIGLCSQNRFFRSQIVLRYGGSNSLFYSLSGVSSRLVPMFWTSIYSTS